MTSSIQQIRTSVESLEALGDIMTSYALAAGVAWPYVTLPSAEFYRHGDHVHTLSGIDAVWSSPVITDVAGWETYAALNVSAGGDVPMSSTIFAYGVVVQQENNGTALGKLPVVGPAPHTPIHQIHSSSTSKKNSSVEGYMENYDMRTEPELRGAYAIVEAYNRTALSGLVTLNLVRDTFPETLDKNEPLSLLLQPIFSSFEDMTIVSYVQTVLEWEFLLSDILQEKQSVFCFVENTCDQKGFTFKIVAGSTYFQGMGDAHDKQYDKYGKSTAIILFPIDEYSAAADACIYTLNVYPTQDYRRSFESKKPQIYTSGIAMVFLLMGITFFFYDRYAF